MQGLVVRGYLHTQRYKKPPLMIAAIRHSGCTCTNSNHLIFCESCHIKLKLICVHLSLLDMLCLLEEHYHLFPSQESGDKSASNISRSRPPLFYTV